MEWQPSPCAYNNINLPIISMHAILYNILIYFIDELFLFVVQILAVSDRGPLVHYNISASLWLNFTVDISTIPPVKWCSIRRHECIDKTDELELHDVYIISNYTISSVGNSNWGVYYIDICDERIMNYTVYLDSDSKYGNVVSFAAVLLL